MTLTIRPLTEKDIPAVADVHSSVFIDSRSTHLGIRYVRKMFHWFSENHPSLCFVADEDGEIMGYVIGAIGGYGRKIFRYALIEIAIGLLAHPGLWLKRDTFTLWYSYLQAFNPALLLVEKGNRTRAGSDINLPTRGALAGIGVLPSARGKGTGKLLVHAFEQAAKDKGAKLLGLSVEIDNQAARQLYENNGWQLDSLQIDLKSAHYSKVIA
jgi:ribosomal protein S18 acetylase RimI-like enzyme